eukprot:gb/GECG01003245.1/.p1 GENE.gb/GECG01003245.1/~~gb/GECG01003245.1/.p1  ORF type:complete len:1171 (+),score=116.23 gb/GECG01003245.1/:1-3513(+)
MLALLGHGATISNIQRWFGYMLEDTGVSSVECTDTDKQSGGMMRWGWSLVKSMPRAYVWGYKGSIPCFRVHNGLLSPRAASNKAAESDTLLYKELEWAQNTLQPTRAGGIRSLSKNQRQRLSHIIQGARNSKDPKLHKNASGLFFKLFGRLIHQPSSYGNTREATAPEYGVLPSTSDCNAILEMLVELDDVKGIRRVLGMCRRSGIDVDQIATTRAMMCFAKADWLPDSLLCLRELLKMCKEHVPSASSSIASTSAPSIAGNGHKADERSNWFSLSHDSYEIAPLDTDIPSVDLVELVPWSVAMPALDSLVTCSVRMQDLDSTCMVLTAMVRLRMPPDSRTVNRIIMAASKQAEERWDSSFSKLRLSRKLVSKKESPAMDDKKQHFALSSDRHIETPLEASWNWFWWLHEYLQLPIDIRNVNLLLRQAGIQDPYAARMSCESAVATERFAFTPERICQRTFAVYHHLRLLMQQRCSEKAESDPSSDCPTADETTLYYLLRVSSNAADGQAFLTALEVAEENNIVLSSKTCGSIVRILAGNPRANNTLRYFLDYISRLVGNSAQTSWSDSKRASFLEGLKKCGRSTLNKTLNYWTMEAFYALASLHPQSNIEHAMFEAAELAILSVCSEALNEKTLSDNNMRCLEKCLSVLDATHAPTQEELLYWSKCFRHSGTAACVQSLSSNSTQPEALKCSIRSSCAAAVLSMMEKLKSCVDVCGRDATVHDIEEKMKRTISLSSPTHMDSYFPLIPMQPERMKLYQRFSRAFDVDVITRLLPKRFYDVVRELRSGPLASISADAFGLLAPTNDTELQLSSTAAATVQNMDQQSLQYVLELLSRSTGDPSLVRSLILIFLELSKHATLYSQKLDHLNAAGYAVKGPDQNPQTASVPPTTWLRVAQAAESSGQSQCSLWLLQCGITSEALSRTLPSVDNDLEMGRLLVSCSHGLSKREAQRRKEIKSDVDVQRGVEDIPETVYRGKMLEKYYGMLPEDSRNNFLSSSLRSLVHMGGATGCFDMTFPGDHVLVLNVSSVVSKDTATNRSNSFSPPRSYLSGKWMGHLLQAYLPMLRLRLQKIWDQSGVAPPGILLHGKAESLETISVALMDCWPLQKPLYHTQLHTQPWLYASPSQVSTWVNLNRADYDTKSNVDADGNTGDGDALATAIVWSSNLISKL